MKTIILDTNALMAIGEFKIDIFTALGESCDFPFTIAVVPGTIDELKKIIREQQGKEQQAARLALSLLDAKKVQILPPATGTVDDLLTSLSRQGYLIVTQDRELKKRLQKPYFTIRQKKTIVMVS